ncbi:MAG: ATP-binding protein [Acidobacteria bacterium]|nr:ATP-binding protein [Acidobacteriota bacterium]
MHRHRLHNLREWLRGPRRKPLVLRGARQVGKSTLVTLLCEADSNRDLLTVNLERYPQLADAFASKDPVAILNVIEAVSGQARSERTVLFLDEIQAAPEAFVSLRYFLEEMPDLPIVAAGSLMDFMLSDHGFSMPVGRIEYLDLGPMTFTEFLRALGEDRLVLEIESFEWTSGDAPPVLHPVVHQRLLELVRLYQFVGGMPEAVKVYSETRSLRATGAVHASIIDTWRDDFPKYAGRRDLTRMLRVFNFAARQVGRKVKYTNISSDDQSATIRRDLDVLAMARVVAKVTHSQCTGLPLQADLKEKVFKLIFLDIGLMNAICGLSWQTIAGQTETQLVNAGPGAEQFIGQHLQFLLAERPNRELTYWLREGRSNNAEVDYVCEFGSRIVPMEVKAGRTGKLKSLHQFVADRWVPFAVRFDTDPPALHTVDAAVRRGHGSEQVRYRLLSLPLYLVERLPSLVNYLAARM